MSDSISFSLRGRRSKGKGKGEFWRAWSRALIPFPFPFERLPRRLHFFEASRQPSAKTLSKIMIRTEFVHETGKYSAPRNILISQYTQLFPNVEMSRRNCIFLWTVFPQVDHSSCHTIRVKGGLALMSNFLILVSHWIDPLCLERHVFSHELKHRNLNHGSIYGTYSKRLLASFS